MIFEVHTYHIGGGGYNGDGGRAGGAMLKGLGGGGWRMEDGGVDGGALCHGVLWRCCNELKRARLYSTLTHTSTLLLCLVAYGLGGGGGLRTWLLLHILYC